MTALIVMAKEPRPGRSKTRLCPPCTPEEAARLAEAALSDTLEAVSRARVGRRVLCLDGEPGPWIRDGFEVVPQHGDGLDERIAAAFAEVGGPAALVGMDTPQVTPDLLELALEALEHTDASLGMSSDGGWWVMGLRRPDPRTVTGVPMSTDETGRLQRERLAELGLSVTDLPVLRDVDTFDDAVAVAGGIPGSRFAAALAVSGPLRTPSGSRRRPR
ncbi:MAG TPA: TIGR04282 family arsenosugar biosynthesis glycosyltransferase [Actinomycetota bacterium]|nr:TIGR04282 family arsenosugar biosynthesis glycosyltransferase [Actinomycetota bacterium]